jgi:hypothetical protein
VSSAAGGAAADDPSVPDDAIVWRRLPWAYTADDEERPGLRRLSSGGFDDSNDGTGMSVHLPAPGETIDQFLKQVHCENDGIAELKVKKIREEGMGLTLRPEPDDPRHYEVTHAPGRSKKSKKRALYGVAELIRQPKR